jgi:PAS domain S-box-containing protein
MSHEHHDPVEPTIGETPPQDEQVPAITMAEVTTLLTFSPDALVFIDAAGTIILVNEQATTLFGYARAELVGQPLEVLLPQRFHAAHLVHRRSYMSQPRMRPMGANLDLVGLRKDKREFPVDISLRPVRLHEKLHVLGAIRDITTQRRLEHERVQQLEQLVLQNTLINLAHDAILVRDQLSRVLS